MNYKEDDYMYKGYENAKEDCIKIIRSKKAWDCVVTVKDMKRELIKEIKKLKCFGEWQT